MKTDLSILLKVKCYGVIGLSIYGFLLMFFYEIIRLQTLSNLDFDPSWQCNVKCDGAIGLAIYAFLLMFDSNMA